MYGPSDVAIHSDGDTIFVSEFNSDRVLVIESSARLSRIRQQFALSKPNGLAFDGERNELYVANAFQLSAAQFNLKNSRINISSKFEFDAGEINRTNHSHHFPIESDVIQTALTATKPTFSPYSRPTVFPSMIQSTMFLTLKPFYSPTLYPSALLPTQYPTMSNYPTNFLTSTENSIVTPCPTCRVDCSQSPSSLVTIAPTDIAPTQYPTVPNPTFEPSAVPTSEPTSNHPTVKSSIEANSTATIFIYENCFTNNV